MSKNYVELHFHSIANKDQVCGQKIDPDAVFKKFMVPDPDLVCPERFNLDPDPDPVCPKRLDLDPDPVNIRPDPQP